MTSETKVATREDFSDHDHHFGSADVESNNKVFVILGHGYSGFDKFKVIDEAFPQLASQKHPEMWSGREA